MPGALPRRQSPKEHAVPNRPGRSSSAAFSASQKNLYGSTSDLTNEASVEQFFVARLLDDLGYRDADIKPKTSLRYLVVARGSSKARYKPDYALEVGGRIRWIVEAKAPSESLDAHIAQCAGYCLGLNRLSKDENPTDHFVLTNGLETRLYRWDSDDAMVTLSFSDFQKSNTKYKRLRDIIGRDRVKNLAIGTKPPKPFELRAESIVHVNYHFAWCHQYIHRKDSLSQAASFIEFVKLIFLKLLSDRAYHLKQAKNPGHTIAANEVSFSVAWIEKWEQEQSNPINAVQFQDLIRKLNKDVYENKRKRIFDADDSIKLRADTVKGVVERLQHVDLSGIDADLNGRLFETFLNATMRGKDLGQYFTPRSVVKLATALADPYASRDRQDIVIDACCGSGGFLIEALSVMWRHIDANPSLSEGERAKFREEVADNRIFGVDISRDPPLARIARMNMYLHGDGGSRIFEADVLDKGILTTDVDDQEQERAKSELRGLLSSPENGFADVILTNPPFAKEYHRRDPHDREILAEYELSYEGAGRTRKMKSSVRSSVLFLERYLGILKPGGRLVAVVDDSILGSRKYREVRAWMRRHFLIRAVVSLPGDAFQRSLARVKTSLVHLVRKTSTADEQGSVFMSYATAVGIDDAARARVLPGDAAVREQAAREVVRISSDFKQFLGGQLTESTEHAVIVPPDELVDRLDVKHVAIKTARQEKTWAAMGLDVASLIDLVDVLYPIDQAQEPEDDEDADNDA